MALASTDLYKYLAQFFPLPIDKGNVLHINLVAPANGMVAISTTLVSKTDSQVEGLSANQLTFLGTTDTPTSPVPIDPVDADVGPLTGV